ANPVLQLAGWGGGPQIQCDPNSLAFGTVRIGTSEVKTVKCTNQGTAIPIGTNLLIGTLDVSPAVVFSAQIEWASYPLTGLAPGQAALIDIAYVPTDTQGDDGVVAVANNGGKGVPVQILVSGTGS